jgi:hypothetical protein
MLRNTVCYGDISRDGFHGGFHAEKTAGKSVEKSNNVFHWCMSNETDFTEFTFIVVLYYIIREINQKTCDNYSSSCERQC